MPVRRTLRGGGWGVTVRCLGAGLMLLLAAAAAAHAQGGPEIQVNTHTTGGQSFPSVCMSSAGDFVVVWESGVPFEDGQDGSFFGVFGQRFAAGGERRGEEFAVNTYTTDYQSFPAVACDAAGNFVVAWSSFMQEGNSDGIFAQRFAGSGAPLGSEFQVNSYTTGPQSYPKVASDGDGNFIVVWNSTGQDGDRDGVFAQRYASSGTPRGTEFRVNSYTTGSQSYPDIAVDPAGGFVVVWASAGQDGDGLGVFARRFASSGLPIGNELQVNTTTSGTQAHPAVDTDGDGGFVVVWSSHGQDGDGLGIVARRYGADGGAIGPEFAVNTYTTGDQVMPDVTWTGASGFVVAWASYGQDGSDAGVFARRFAAAGAPIGTEFQVNSFTTGPQYSSSLAASDAGDFVVAWASHQAGGSFSDVIARWYAAPTPTSTATPPPTATATFSPTASRTRSPTRTRTPTAGPMASASPTESPSPTTTPTPEPSNTPTDTSTPTATETDTPAPTATVPPLPGDCNGDGRVTIDEVLLAISIAFGKADLEECETADHNRDGRVTIEELVAVVGAALATA
jgi:hypothetical protein